MKLSAKALVKKYMGTLDHFLTQGGYPVLEHKQDGTALSAAIPALYYNPDSSTLSLDGAKKFPDKVLAEFWKQKYIEERKEASKLYSLIDDAYRKANN